MRGGVVFGVLVVAAGVAQADIDIEHPCVVAGIRFTLLAQWQNGRLRWALCSDHAAIWSGWAGSA